MADPVGPTNWYMNSERTIWAVHQRAYSTGGNKTYWVRPAGTDLLVSGYLVGSPAIKLRVTIPCCYITGFQIVGLHFEVAGCWQVSATAGDHQLEFVTEVLNHQ